VLLVREVIRLENLPLVVHLAPDGQRAIEFIEKAEKDPDAPFPQLILLDLNLPKKDGFEVLRRLRASEKCKGVPVVIVTSSDAPTDLSQAIALGAGYFRKPPSYEEFLKLGEVLRKLIPNEGRSDRSPGEKQPGKDNTIQERRLQEKALETISEDTPMSELSPVRQVLPEPL